MSKLKQELYIRNKKEHQDMPMNVKTKDLHDSEFGVGVMTNQQQQFEDGEETFCCCCSCGSGGGGGSADINQKNDI